MPTHKIDLKDGVNSLLSGEYTIEIVTDISAGLTDTDGYSYTQVGGFNTEGDGCWTVSNQLGSYMFFTRASSALGPKGTGAMMSGNISYTTTNNPNDMAYRAVVGPNFPGVSAMTLGFVKASANSA